MTRSIVLIVCGVAACQLIVAPAARAQVLAEISGRIVANQSGAAIVGATIDATTAVGSATSDADGRFVIRGVDPGAVTVHVRAIGFAPVDTMVIAANTRATQLTVRLVAITRMDSIVTTATRGTQPLVFDRATIDASGKQDLGELLTSAPGVVITRGGGPGSAERASIRGSSASEVLVLVDGVPVNSAITGDADLSRIPLSVVDRVTVTPGADAGTGDARALAGVIRVETRRTANVSIDATGGSLGQRSGAVSVGSMASAHGHSMTAAAVVEYRAVGDGFAYDVPAVRGGGTAQRANDASSAANVLATASIGTDSGGVTGRVVASRDDRGMPGSVVQPSLTGTQHDERANVGLDGRWRALATQLSARIDLSAERTHLADHTPPFGSAFDDTISAHAVDAAITAAHALRWLSITGGGDVHAVSLASNELSATAPSTSKSGGAWASGRVTRALTSSLTVAVDGGARTDWDSRLSAAVVSPRGGIALDAPHTSLTLSVRNGFNPPALADLFFHEGVLVKPNPGLAPERVKNETELRATVADVVIGPARVSGDVAAYRADIDGMIVWMPNFVFVWSPDNVNVHRRGIDASTQIAVDRLGVIVHGSTSVADVDYAEPALSGQVTYRPRATSAAGLDVARFGFDADVSAQWIGPRRTVPGSALNTLAPYTLENVVLRRPWRLSTWAIDPRLSVDNLFNARVAMLPDYPFPGRTWALGVRVSRAAHQ